MQMIWGVVLALAGAWLALLLLRIVLILRPLLRTPLHPPADPALQRQTPPPALSSDQQAMVDEVQALGFELLGIESLWRQGRHCAMALLRHRQQPAYAVLVLYPNLLTGYPLGFYSFAADGRIIATGNRMAWQAPLVGHGTDFADALADSPALHWQAHEQRLADAVALDPEPARARLAPLDQQAFDWARQAGHIVQRGGQWHIAVPTAWRMTLQALRQRPRLARPFHCSATQPEHADAYLLNCWQARQAEHSSQADRPLLKLALLGLSAAAALALWGLSFDWTFALGLMGVLLLHELGHALAMRAFGWRDVSIFFIPFFGAAASGRPDPSREARAWQQVVVLLAGPLPGLLLGAAALRWGPAAGGDGWAAVAILAVVLNALNLLPLPPLDGGRLLQLALPAHGPRPQLWLSALGAAAFLLAAYHFKDAAIAVLGVLMLLALPHEWRVATLNAAAAREGGQAPTPARLLQLARARYPKLRAADTLQLLDAVQQQARHAAVRGWERIAALLPLAAVLALLGPWLVPEIMRPVSSPPDGRSTFSMNAPDAAQQAFDEAWYRIDGRDADEVSPAENAELQRLAQQLSRSDPRHTDMAMRAAQALPPDQRQAAIDALLRGPRDGQHGTRRLWLQNALAERSAAAASLPPAERAEQLRAALAWADSLQPGLLAATLDTRLRLAEAIDLQGDTEGAERLLNELAQQAGGSADAALLLEPLRLAQAWWALNHQRPQQALQLMDAAIAARPKGAPDSHLLAERAWVRLLAGQAAAGLADMEASSQPDAHGLPLAVRLLMPTAKEPPVRNPLELAFALQRNGREAEARAALTTLRGRRQCERVLADALADAFNAPWQALRRQQLRATAEALCPAR